MGQDCCLRLSGGKSQQQKGLKTQLIQKTISPKHSTIHDKEFTYFLGVFELQELGDQLKQPDYIDQLHPDFSYQKFNVAYKNYYKQVTNLGSYIASLKKQNSSLNIRKKIDLQQITTLRAKLGKQKSDRKGCLIKIQIQGMKNSGVNELGIIHTHPQTWSEKYQKWIKVKNFTKEPMFFQFPVPQIINSTLKIVGRPKNCEIQINISDSFQKNKTIFCQFFKWKGDSSENGIALRIQLVNGDSDVDKGSILQMTELFQKLNSEFGDGFNLNESPQINEKVLSQRLSRHRTSLHGKYNLNDNDKF